jgi:amino acid adenylation domain-containing protein
MHTALAHFAEVLEQTPQTAVRAIEVMGENERLQVLYDWNATEAEYPEDKCIHQLLEAQVDKTPDAVAVVYEEQSLTYKELNSQANRLARHLIDLGVKPDMKVAICVERSLEMVVGLFAILKAGGAYVPLDPGYPAERLEFMLEDSAPVALLTQSALKERWTDLQENVAVIELDAGTKAWASRSAVNPSPGRLGLTPQHLAYVIYTSGSTGKPKGVMVEHQGLVNYSLAAAELFGLTGSDIVLQQNTLTFDLSVEEMFPALVSGAAILPNQSVFGLSESDGHQEGPHPTCLHLTAAHWHYLVAEWSRSPEAAQHDLREVRLINVTGDQVSNQKLQLWDALRPEHVRLINTYGPTEATVSCTAGYVHYDPAKRIVPIGIPFANTRLYMLDQYRQPVPAGVAGELYVGGIQVARGYLNRAELTAECFVPDPFVKSTAAEPDPRMYKTGDLGRWLDDGTIEFLGRNDFQVKIRGFRIELGEIEARLAEMDGVKEAAILARQDSSGDKRLVGYYTGSEELSVESLRTHLSGALPDYMVPAAFVRLEALPLTPNGKLDRKALPAPEDDAFSASAYEEPQGEAEQTLAAIWSELLNIEKIGRYDQFFDLGGHSLLAITLVSRIRTTMGVELQLADLFDYRTLSEIAGYIQGVSTDMEEGEI